VSAAAATPSPLQRELEQTLGRFEALLEPARHAVTSVAASLVEDPGASELERDVARALLALAHALRA
jgi:hypothetical protein